MSVIYDPILGKMRQSDKPEENKYMLPDGSNYIPSLALVTPLITSTWVIKNQQGVQQSTSSNNAITVENGAKVDYSGASRCTSVGEGQVAPTVIAGDFGNTTTGSATAKDIVANKVFKVTYAAPKGGLEVVGTKVVPATGNQTTSAQASVSFAHRRFYGVSIAPNTDITTLATELNNSRAKTVTFDCSGGKYFYYAYPKVLGKAAWNVGGLSIGMTPTEVTITNEYGLSVAYYVYRSDNLQTGSSIKAIIS